MTQQTELLAPAGDIEAGYAALYYGADAVYLGLPKFRPVPKPLTLLNPN